VGKEAVNLIMAKPRSSLDWLDSLASEATFTPQDRTLDTMRSLLAALDHPERSFRAIHITGTAGKGSVAEMITRILVAAGIRVGTYGSPHVYRINERIRIDGQEISNERLDAALQVVQTWSVKIGLQPRWFEALTAAAFVIFRDEQLPWAVVEVGLGGRLDTTNVFDRPALTIVTSIGLDHQAFLGNTETDIARDKAGIFRIGVPALIGDVSKEAHAAIATEANRIGAPLIQLPMLDIQLPAEPLLIGPHQIRNAQLAVGTVSVLSSSSRSASGESDIKDPVHLTQRHGSRIKSGMTITKRAIIGGLQSATLPGRFEILSHNPLVIFDVAHNPMKITALVETIEGMASDVILGSDEIRHRKSMDPRSGASDESSDFQSRMTGKFTTIIGIKKDKDAGAILKLLDQITDRYIFVDLPDVPHWQPSDLVQLTKKSSSLELDWDNKVPLLVTGSFHLGQSVQALGVSPSSLRD
jgi:dihydrofolate synthase/folylpolyglutamate synthase